MAVQIALLRGVNLGPRNRVPMADLRRQLARAGFDEPRTYLQSGNVILSTRASPDETARTCERVIADGFGLEIPVVVRTRAELARVVRRDPFGEVASEPRRYQVSFLSGELADDVVARLEAAAAGGERLVVHGREVYAWHPAGIGRSKLWAALAGKGLGVTATARNWATVTKLLELAEE